MPEPTPLKLTEEECLGRLGEVRSEVRLPGYWATLAGNCNQWASEVSVGPYWSKAKQRLDQWRMDYRSATDADLLTQPGLPPFVSKPEASIRDKLFRRCAQDTENLKNLYDTEGPAVPRLGDLVRTRISCQYIDGVEFLANKLTELAEEMALGPTRQREGKIEGYFAQHITIPQEVIYRFAGTAQITKVKCEVQVASELGTRMWDASHPLYDMVRRERSAPEDWQWRPDDPRFLANQLGHMIHLADGLLVQLRQSTKARKE